MNANTPPGRRTRATSANKAAAGWMTTGPKTLTTASTLASGSGSLRPSAHTKGPGARPDAHSS